MKQEIKEITACIDSNCVIYYSYCGGGKYGWAIAKANTRAEAKAMRGAISETARLCRYRKGKYIAPLNGFDKMSWGDRVDAMDAYGEAIRNKMKDLLEEAL